MKICMVSPDFINDGGGLEWSIQRIANFMADAGHTVHVVGLSPNREDKHLYGKQSTITECLAWRDDVRFFDISPWFSKPGTDYAWHEIYKGLQSLNNDHNYDVFHALNISYSGYITTMIAHQFAKPIILSGRGSDINRNVFSVGVFSKIRWSLERADFITFVSHAMQATANQIAPCLHKSVVILNSTDKGFFETLPNVSPIFEKDEQTFLIGGAGILGRKKGIDILTKVMQMLVTHKQPVKMLWIGELEAMRDECRFFDEFEALRISGHIQLTGIVAHQRILDYLRLLDVYVLASIDEGCPNALLEAMLSSRPIVATEVGAVPEIIRNGQEGLLVPPYDVQRLADAVMKLISDVDLRNRLGQAAHERVTVFCTPEKERLAWLRCYDLVYKQ